MHKINKQQGYIAEYSGYFAMLKNIESLCCTSKTNTIGQTNYNKQYVVFSIILRRGGRAPPAASGTTKLLL